MKLNKLKIAIFLGILLTVSAISFVGYSVFKNLNDKNNDVGSSQLAGERGGTWHIFDSFNGFQTKFDAEKIADGANPNGQNTTVNEGDRISIRDLGYDLFPSTGEESVTTSPINSLHTFRKRDGENIMLRSHGTSLDYFEELNDTWEMVTSTTATSSFGFADFNINTDLVSYVYFGNAVDPTSRWTGEHTLLNGVVTAGAVTINVDSTAGFLNTNGTIILCGIQASYTGKSATSFTGVTGAPNCADNRSLIEAPAYVSAAPRGNILITMDNRLWIAGVSSSTQAIFFSKYGDATNFTTTTIVEDNTDTSSGIFNLGEGGGGVTAMVQDESALYMFKRSIIRKATLNDTTYTLSTLKPFDGKSQTVGAVSNFSSFTSGNEVFFITPDNQIMKLARVESVDYPQITSISNIIKPTVDSATFASSTGIVFRDKAYFSFKSDSDSSANDSVFVYNLKTGAWDSPIVGWNVADFVVYDDGNGEELYFGDGRTTNVYKVISDPVDYIYDTTASWRSKQHTFGAPNVQKQVDSVYIEGYIAPNTTLNIALLLDDNGFTQKFETTLVGTETSYLYGDDVYNPFGYHPFGYERFGTGDDTSGKKKFRVYLNRDFTAVPFYTAQIEFSSDGSNQQWEITNYAMNVRLFTQQSKPSLYKKFQ